MVNADRAAIAVESQRKGRKLFGDGRRQQEQGGNIMHSMLARLLKGYEHQYPHNLENKYARVFNSIMSVWGTSQADDYFRSLFFDDRGGRQGFPEHVMSEILFLARLHDKFRDFRTQKDDEDVWSNEAFAKRLEEECNIEFSPRGFFWAAEKSHDKALGIFIEAGVDVNLRNQFGWTPLMVTTFLGSEESATLLITHGANVSVCDNRGYTPLHWAAQRGYAKVADLLLQRGAYPNVKSKKGLTPLIQAAALGRTEVVKVLLARGASANAPDNEGWAPLHKAVANNHLEIVRMLIDANADPRSIHSSGVSPVSIARKSGNPEMIKAVGG